jgi:hypothetical protein
MAIRRNAVPDPAGTHCGGSLSRFAEAAAAADPDRAEAIVGSIEGEEEQNGAWFAVALARAAANPDPQMAEASARAAAEVDRRAVADPDQAVAAARSLRNPHWRRGTLLKIVEAVMAADPDRAEVIARQMTDTEGRDEALLRLAVAVAAADSDHAEGIVRSIEGAGKRAAALSQVAVAVAAADPDRAEATARSIGAQVAAIAFVRAADLDNRSKRGNGCYVPADHPCRGRHPAARIRRSAFRPYVAAGGGLGAVKTECLVDCCAPARPCQDTHRLARLGRCGFWRAQATARADSAGPVPVRPPPRVAGATLRSPGTRGLAGSGHCPDPAGDPGAGGLFRHPGAAGRPRGDAGHAPGAGSAGMAGADCIAGQSSCRARPDVLRGGRGRIAV